MPDVLKIALILGMLTSKVTVQCLSAVPTHSAEVAAKRAGGAAAAEPDCTVEC